MAYKKTEARANFPELESEMSKFWAQNDTFHRVRAQNANGKTFRFFDGPATPSSIPHLGHLGVSAVKDMVVRFKNMTGHNVIHKLGWDVHGLPTEVMVEKETGKPAKEIVAEVGIEKFCDMCRSGVMKYVDDWGVFLNRLGRWVDTTGGRDTVYNTMHPEYMESVIWALKKLYDDGLLYKDFKVNPFDWKLGTVMSNSEASSEYADIVDDAVTVWFEMENGKRILAWTTTPWTLPGNLALAVNPKMTYAVMRDTDGSEYIIAESRLAAYEKQFENAERVGELSGANLVGLKYHPLFPYYENHENRAKLYQIIAADYVSDADGTGTVHIAPAFGEEDYLALKAIDAKFPVIVNVDDYGNFDETVTDWAGMNIFDANPKIMEHLKNTGHLVKKENYKHSYPFSPRTKVKLIYRASPSWYIDVPKIRDRLIANNNLVDWKSAGGRFSSWIENARPWGISRNRFWGVPLPIWTNDAGEFKVFGSIAEMNEFFGVEIKDLHRPTLDKLSKDGWNRIPDVLDAWFESGSMPYAAEHYPFENADLVNAPDYMSDYIIEGQDQTRGWFYTLMVLSTALFDRPAFKTINANGMTVDEHKKKMSKSLGNYVDPTEILDTYGADAVRLYILGSNFLKAEPVPIDKDGKVFSETVKNILTPLWNAYHFFTLYANAGNVTAKKYQTNVLPEQTDPTKIDSGWFNAPNIMDRYILTELNELFRVANDGLNSYQPDVVIREITKFLDILNNWYIRRTRERFWDEDQSAFDTLWTVLTYLTRVIAPFAPFVSDYIYKNLTGNESVHLQKYPYYTENADGVKLQSEMRRIQSIVSVGKSLREVGGLRNRLPLAHVTIATADGDAFTSDYIDIIKDELNVKSVIATNDVAAVADSFIFPITPKIGARLGSALREIIPAIKQGKYKIDNGQLIIDNYVLNPDEFETRLTIKPGITGAALPDNTAVVVIDTNVTPELIAEGLARDALRFIQDTRREMNLDVSNRINLEYDADGEMATAIDAHRDMIMENALVVDMAQKNATEYTTEIEGHKFGIKITKA